MREILFRGKSKGNGKWVEGNLLTDKGGNASIALIMEPARNSVLEPVIPETVGQYTGVDDINGNKIFDGDIVRLLYDGDYITTAGNGLIKRIPGGFQAYYKKDAVKSSYDFGENRYQHEIIGNIYDNPELLEEVK